MCFVPNKEKKCSWFYVSAKNFLNLHTNKNCGGSDTYFVGILNIVFISDGSKFKIKSDQTIATNLRIVDTLYTAYPFLFISLQR